MNLPCVGRGSGVNKTHNSKLLDGLLNSLQFALLPHCSHEVTADLKALETSHVLVLTAANQVAHTESER